MNMQSGSKVHDSLLLRNLYLARDHGKERRCRSVGSLRPENVSCSSLYFWCQVWCFIHSEWRAMLVKFKKCEKVEFGNVEFGNFSHIAKKKKKKITQTLCAASHAPIPCFRVLFLHAYGKTRIISSCLILPVLGLPLERTLIPCPLGSSHNGFVVNTLFCKSSVACFTF